MRVLVITFPAGPDVVEDDVEAVVVDPLVEVQNGSNLEVCSRWFVKRSEAV